LDEFLCMVHHRGGMPDGALETWRTCDLLAMSPRPSLVRISARHIVGHVGIVTRGSNELEVSWNRRNSQERENCELIGMGTSRPRVSGEDDDKENLQARTIIINRGQREVCNV
jgi:hypothetical protein